MNNQLHKEVVVAIGCAALIMNVLPAIAQADDSDLAKKIDTLQKEIEAFKVEGKSIPSAPSAGSVVTSPPGLEFSVYGVGHLSADGINTGIDSNSYIHSNSSRLGLKGSYSLDDRGDAAFFQYESGVDLTGNGTGDGNGIGANNSLFTRARDSFVGIKGGWGTATVGRLPALNQWLYDYNLFADQVGDLGNIWAQNQPDRVDSAFQYGTPDFYGLTAAVTYAPNGNQGPYTPSGNQTANPPGGTQGTKNESMTIAKLNYSKGGLNLGGAFASYERGTGLSTQKANAVTASYNFGIFTLGGGLQWETDIAGISGANQNESTIGGAVEVASGETLKFQYAQAGSLSTVANSGGRQLAIGYDHAWNKQTTLYVAYAQTKNESAASYQSYGFGHGNEGVPAVVPGQNTSVLSFGIIYRFDMNRLALSKI